MTLLSTLRSVPSIFRQPHAGKGPVLRRALQRIVLMNRVYRQRQALLSMEPTLLDDIGLNRDEARAEAARPIWDVPQTWRA